MTHAEQRQQINESILTSVDAFFDIHHRSPTVRELMDMTGLSLGGISKYLNRLNDNGGLFFDGRNITTPKIMKCRSECVYAGLLGSVSCGPATESEEEMEDYYPLPRDLFGGGPLYLLRASGDSMTGAGIEDGDLIAVQKTEEAREGQIVVAWIEGEGNTLKRLKKKKDGKMTLHPENPKYADIPLENARLQGVAVKILKDVK